MSTKADSVKLYKVRKLISELASKEGRGTELVSLYVPPKKPVHEVIANLREEWGTAGNIKSDTTRNHVQDALTRTMQRLKLYRTTPDNGLVIFCGALPTNGPGSEVINLNEIIPPKPVVQYLYQCLSPDASVLLDDGRLCSLEALKSDWRSQRVVSYDFGKKRLTGTRVRRYVKTSAGSRKSYELVAESGRRILATEDHPFWTPRGWVRLGAIKRGDLVAVVPIADLESRKKSGKAVSHTIVDEASLRRIPDPPKNFDLAVRKLREWGLLPLKEDNPKLLLIARMLGHLFSDGSLTRNLEQRKNGPYVHFTMDCCLGSWADERDFRDDLSKLGYRPPRGRKVTYTMSIDGREYQAAAIHVKVRNSALSTLFRALGAPVGSKVKNGTVLPNWLTTSPRAVKREFLAGYLGGDGEAPRFVKMNLSSGERLSFHRIEEKAMGGLEFAKGLRQMLSEFGVVVINVSSAPGYARKDGYRTVEVQLRIKLSEDNILRLCHGIGFAYCARKKARADLVGEYLRVKARLREEALRKMDLAKGLKSSGMPVKQIGGLLSLAPGTVGQWVSGSVLTPLVTSAHLPPFKEWVRLAKNGLDDPLVWETVVSMKPVELSDVRDITVEESGHSFVANGFLVHNCDDHFHLEWLKDMLREEKVYGILAVDASEAGLGILSGDSLEIPDVITSGISGKTRKGGQSARRYERGREMELTYYYHRVAEHATRVFIENAKVTGLVVGGPGPTKEEFLKGDFLHYELRKKVVAVIDLGYSGREGVRELVEKASDVLKDVRLIEEKKLVQKFLFEVNKAGGLAVYGLPRVLDAIQRANTDVVLVSDDLNTVRIEAKCKKCGTVRTETATGTTKTQKKQEAISEPCAKCGGTDFDVSERDVIDVLEEMAFQVGSRVEVISSGTEEGNMFKTFGGVAAILRYRAS